MRVRPGLWITCNIVSPAFQTNDGAALVASHHRLPGGGEALGIERAVDPVAVLHVVDAGARFQQGVQQQPFLHRGQRIDVLDLAGRHRQGVQLRLAQLRQRKSDEVRPPAPSSRQCSISACSSAR